MTPTNRRQSVIHLSRWPPTRCSWPLSPLCRRPATTR